MKTILMEMKIRRFKNLFILRMRNDLKENLVGTNDVDDSKGATLMGTKDDVGTSKGATGVQSVQDDVYSDSLTNTLHRGGKNSHFFLISRHRKFDHNFFHLISTFFPAYF